MSFEKWRAAGREAAVIGLGQSGVAASLLLRQHGIPVYASDASPEAGGNTCAQARPSLADQLQAAGVAVELGRHDLARIARAGVCVVSPGVPPDAAPAQAARQAGVAVASELDVGFAALAGAKYAVLTGTNGKSTTTALTGHLLQAAGLGAVTAGNIGRALSQVALDGERPQWVALEVSSFQLHDTHDLVPTIGALTNLAPDHLDRYATIEDYYADKDRLYLRAGQQSWWITNADDPEVQRRSRDRPGRQARFSVAGAADAWFDRTGSALVLDSAPVLARGGLALLGDHNVSNALCAALIAARAGAPRNRIADGLRTFRPLPHRLEPIREVGGVLWINDSKATNVASTAMAVRALERPFVLLLGGRHKGEPYTGLAQAAGERCRAVIAYGESRDLVARDLTGLLRVERAATDFGEVLARARRLARVGDAVLLSPACSSYDMFRNYEDRGDQFRAAVEEM